MDATIYQPVGGDNIEDVFELVEGKEIVIKVEHNNSSSQQQLQ